MELSEAIEQAQRGNAEGWGELVKSYFNFICFLAEKWLTPSMVDEETIGQVTGGIFKSLTANNMERLKEYKPGTPFNVFIRRTARDWVANFCVKKKIEFKYAHDLDLDRVSASIAPGAWVGLRLYALCNQSISDAADITGMDSKTLRALVEELNPSAPAPDLPPADPGSQAIFGDAEDGKSTQHLKD